MRSLIGLVSMWCVAIALGAQDISPARWTVEWTDGRAEETAYVPVPIRISTVAGALTLAPGELQRVDFLEDGGATVFLVHGDLWVTSLKPRDVRRMIAERSQRKGWDAVRSFQVQDVAPGDPPAPVSWQVEFRDGSRAQVEMDGASIRIQQPEGESVVPLRGLQSIRMNVEDPALSGTAIWFEEKNAIRGSIAPGPLRARDRSGREIAISLADVSSLSRLGMPILDSGLLQLSRPAVVLLMDGTWVETQTTHFVLPLKTADATWPLPSTRLLQVIRNRDGTHSVQTVAGDWLTGRLEPRQVSVGGGEGQEPVLADFIAIQWAGEEIDLPPEHATWRLASGDLLVAQWLEANDSGASSNEPLARGVIAESNPRLPRKMAGNWPVPRFSIRHWAGGEIVSIPAARVEAIRDVPPAMMPPALPPAGPSAIHSDEVQVPGGTFEMGRRQGEGPRDETPPVSLFLTPFWLARTPVTVAQFDAFVAATRYETDAERIPGEPTWRTPGFVQRSEDPVVCVSWRDAAHYCNWLSTTAGLTPCYEIRLPSRDVAWLPGRNGYRLPLEAEWEFAARSGGTPVDFPWGNGSDESTVLAWANFRPASDIPNPWPWTSPVKRFPPNPAGFFDMAGNVWEWCQDIYLPDAYLRLQHGETLESLLHAPPGADPDRSMRGGSYAGSMEFLRCTVRGFGRQSRSAPRVGFRVARNADPVGP